MPAPHLDHDGRSRLGDTAGFADGGYDVVGEEERVEAGDEIEAVVVIRQRLHVAHLQISVGKPLVGNLE